MDAWRWYWVIYFAHKMAVSRKPDAGIYVDKRDSPPVAHCRFLWAGHQGQGYNTLSKITKLVAVLGLSFALASRLYLTWTFHSLYKRCSVFIESTEKGSTLGSGKFVSERLWGTATRSQNGNDGCEDSLQDGDWWSHHKVSPRICPGGRWWVRHSCWKIRMGHASQCSHSIALRDHLRLCIMSSHRSKLGEMAGYSIQ